MSEVLNECIKVTMKRSYEQQNGTPAPAPAPGQPGFVPLYPPAAPPTATYAAANPAYMQAYAAAYAQAQQANPYAMYAGAMIATTVPSSAPAAGPVPVASTSAAPAPVVAGPLHPAFANYGYGPQHPSHQQNAQAQHQQGATASPVPSPYPVPGPFPPQPFAQASPPSKRPRYDSGSAQQPPVPSPLQPPPPPPVLRPVLDPSRPVPPPTHRAPLPPRPHLPPPYNGPSGPPPAMNGGPFNGHGGYNGPPPPGRPYDMPPSPMSQAMPMAGPSRYNGPPPPRRDGPPPPPMRNGPPLLRDGGRSGGPPPGGSSYRPGPDRGRGPPPYRGRGGSTRGGGPRYSNDRSLPTDGRRAPSKRERAPPNEDKRRTFSDFRIIGIEIAELDWSWEADLVAAAATAASITAASSREPSMAPPETEEQRGSTNGEATPAGKHARETDSEDDYEAEMTSKRVKAEREPSQDVDAGEETGDAATEVASSAAPVDVDVGTANGKSVDGDVETSVTSTITSPGPTPSTPATDENVQSQDAKADDAVEASGTIEAEDLDGEAIEDPLAALPFNDDPPARPASPAGSQASTVGKRTFSRATSVAKVVGSRLRIYFASPRNDRRTVRPPRRPPIPSRPVEATPEPEAETESKGDVPTDLEEAAKAAAEEPTVEAPAEPSASKRARSPSPSPGPSTSQPLAPSADRVSISYARNTRRIIVDASAVSEVRLHRGEHRIELDVQIDEDAEPQSKAPRRDPHHRICRGVFIEAMDRDADDFVTLDLSALRSAWDERDDAPAKDADSDVDDAHDELLPPLHRLSIGQEGERKSPEDHPVESSTPRKLTITVHLEKDNPLQEARWVRNGEVDEWIAQNTGSNASDAGWQGKIKVVDPDPPPTFQHAIDTWIEACTLAPKEDLRRFATTHMANPDNVIEVLLRIVRGDARLDRPYNVLPPPQPPAVAKLARQLDAPYPAHQTHVSLATLQLYRLAVDQSGPEGSESRRAMEKRIGEVVRALPYHLVFRVLDAMAKEVLRL